MSTHDTTLLTAIVEKHEQRESGFSVRSFSITGEPWAAAKVRAVVAHYPRPDTIPEILEDLIGQKVTILIGAGTAFGSPLVVARPGTLFRGSAGGVAILPKGKRNKGFVVKPDDVLDVVKGYNGAEKFQAQIDSLLATLPEFGELTKERLAQLPVDAVDDEGNTSDCTLAVIGTWHSPSGAKCEDAVWMVCGYDPEDDIVDGILFVRPESDGFSEHGSCYGRDLLRFGAEAVSFPGMSFRDALALTDADHDTVLAALRAPATV